MKKTTTTHKQNGDLYTITVKGNRFTRKKADSKKEDSLITMARTVKLSIHPLANCWPMPV